MGSVSEAVGSAADTGGWAGSPVQPLRSSTAESVKNTASNRTVLTFPPHFLLHLSVAALQHMSQMLWPVGPFSPNLPKVQKSG
jgi:hypothetical protein